MAVRIAVASPQGGTGRTTLVAHLAARLTQAGRRCLAIDLDPQNMLSLWLGGNPSAWIAGQSQARTSLSVLNLELGPSALAQSLRDRRASVPHVPFGARDGARRDPRMESLTRPDGLRARLNALEPASCELMLIDTPSGENAFSEAALADADIVLVPLRADAGSLASLSNYEHYLRSVCTRAFPDSVYYVLTMFDPTRPLACDVADVLAECVDGRVLPRVIHEDESVREQFARGAPFELQAVAQAAHDYAWLAGYLGQTRELSGPSSSAHAS